MHAIMAGRHVAKDAINTTAVDALERRDRRVITAANVASVLSRVKLGLRVLRSAY